MRNSKLFEVQLSPEFLAVDHCLSLLLFQQAIRSFGAKSIARNRLDLDLKTGEELVGILVFAHIKRFAIIILKSPPKSNWAVVLPVAQSQICKCGLHHNLAVSVFVYRSWLSLCLVHGRQCWLHQRQR